MLTEGANIGFKIKEYKALKDFCSALKKTMVQEQQTLNTEDARKGQIKAI